MTENTSRGRSRAGSPKANGHNSHAMEVNPFDTPEGREKRRKRKEAEQAAAAASSATVVSGRYAADACTGLSAAGRKALTRLIAVNVADLAAVGALTGPRPTRRDVDAWHAQRREAWNPPPANGTASLSEVRVATAGIDPKARCALADVVRAADDGQTWATAVVDAARGENTYAALVGDRKQRPVWLTTAQLYDRGVPPEAIAALPAATTVALGESARIVRAWDAEDRLRANEQAHAAEAARLAAGYANITTRVDLATYTPPNEPCIVDGLIPLGKSLGLFSERKAGKTTANVDLTRSLLTGEKFFGRFATHLPADAEVVFLDTEMGADMMQYEFSKAGVSDPALLRRINYHDLCGRSAMLDFRIPAVRAYWREQITPGSFVIFDCLYTVLSALGVDESSSQVADVIEGFKTCAVECDAAGRVLTHHVGKDSDKGARGHSSIEGAVDTLAYLRLEGPPAADTPRTFAAFGRRGVSVPPALLTLDSDHHPVLSDSTPRADRAKAADRKDDAIVWQLINDHPGESVNTLADLPIETRHGVGRNRLRRAVDRLDVLGDVVNKGTLKRPKWHAAARNADAFTIAAAAPERDGDDGE